MEVKDMERRRSCLYSWETMGCAVWLVPGKESGVFCSCSWEAVGHAIQFVMGATHLRKHSAIQLVLEVESGR